MGPELEDQWCMALDCGYRGYGIGLGWFCGIVAVECTCAVNYGSKEDPIDGQIDHEYFTTCTNTKRVCRHSTSLIGTAVENFEFN